MNTCKLCGGKYFGSYWDIGEKVCEWVCDKCVSIYGAIGCYKRLRKFVLPENIGYRPEYPPLDPDANWDTAGIT